MGWGSGVSASTQYGPGQTGSSIDDPHTAYNLGPADWLSSVQPLIQQLMAQITASDVGPGKRFATAADLQSWISGTGHGFEEAFGAGPTNDKDPSVRALVNLTRYANGGKVSGSALQDIVATVPAFGTALKNAGFVDAQGNINYDNAATGALKNLDDPNATTNGPSAADQAQYQTWRDQQLQQLQNLGNSYQQAAQPGSPGYNAAQAQGLQMGGQQALAAGQSGASGLGVANTQYQASNATNQYSTQMLGLGQQTTNSLYSQLNQNYEDAVSQNQYQQSLNAQIAAAKQAQTNYGNSVAAQGLSTVAGVTGTTVSGLAGGVTQSPITNPTPGIGSGFGYTPPSQ